MFGLKAVAIPVLILLSNIGSEGKDFKRIDYCWDGDGCSWHWPYFTLDFSQAVDPCAAKIPLNVRCAHWCQKKTDCVGFNYYSSGRCEMFDLNSYKIYQEPGCTLYEVDTADHGNFAYDAAYGRKTCQSSSAMVNGLPAAAWNLVDEYAFYSCAQTDKSDTENWWMIDMDRPRKLKYVVFTTNGLNSLSRLMNMAIAVTNSSWNVRNPTADNDISSCGVVNFVLAVRTRYKCNCDQNVLPGRYLIIRQAIMTETSSQSVFSLCSVEAYLS